MTSCRVVLSLLAFCTFTICVKSNWFYSSSYGRPRKAQSPYLKNQAQDSLSRYYFLHEKRNVIPNQEDNRMIDFGDLARGSYQPIRLSRRSRYRNCYFSPGQCFYLANNGRRR